MLRVAGGYYARRASRTWRGIWRSLVDRLDPRDHFGLVVFDDRVDVAVPVTRLADKAAVKRAIAGVQTGGSTDLSGGYLRGLQEARRVAGAAGVTVLIISDGHANVGITGPDTLARVAAEAYTHRVTGRHVNEASPTAVWGGRPPALAA